MNYKCVDLLLVCDFQRVESGDRNNISCLVLDIEC